MHKKLLKSLFGSIPKIILSQFLNNILLNSFVGVIKPYILYTYNIKWLTKFILYKYLIQNTKGT